MKFNLRRVKIENEKLKEENSCLEFNLKKEKLETGSLKDQLKSIKDIIQIKNEEIKELNNQIKIQKDNINIIINEKKLTKGDIIDISVKDYLTLSSRKKHHFPNRCESSKKRKL